MMKTVHSARSRARRALSVASVLTALLLAQPASAGVVVAREARFEADVANAQMSRISIEGEKVVSIRKVDDPTGPQILVEVEEATGDVYVAFEDDVLGRSFSLFLITESGKTIQALLRPVAGEGQNVVVRLDGSAAAAAAPSGASRSAGAVHISTSGATTYGNAPTQRSDRRSTYPETMTAFVRMMFNGDAPAGVSRRAGSAEVRRAGPFELAVAEIYELAGLRGQVLALRNTSKVDVAVTPESYMVSGVLAVAVSHEVLPAGTTARVYIVEEVR